MPRPRMHVWPAAGLLASFLFLAAPLLAQQPKDSLSIKTGLSAEYLNRTISWEEGAFSSRLGGLLFAFQAEVEVRRGLSACLHAGYALSDFDGLVFRQLPFSVEYQAGSSGGLIFGGGFRARLVPSTALELEFEASFDVCLGFRGDWAIEGLAIEGALEGRSTWMRVAAGPVLWYKGLAYFVYPYLRVEYNALWGTFRMSETVANLEGTEEKQVRGRGPVAVSLGVQSDVSDVIGLRAEVTAVPRGGGLDVGASGRLIFSF